jgi:23S rRNA pseudouridine2605 synthase
LIVEGRVEIDGQTVTELGTQVDTAVADVRVDGSPVRPQRPVYFLLNKPPGVVTTNRDPQGRTRVVDLIQEHERVFPVGRLDRSSEGLILLTNDGDLAQQLAHPKYGVRKIYRVTVAGKVDRAKLAQMRKGIYIAEGRVAVDGAKLLRQRGKATELEIVLREGKNREIRRILARLGHKVLSLKRIAIGPLRLGELPRGAYRPVAPHELKRLREEVFHQSRRQRDAGNKRTEAEEGRPRRGNGRKSVAKSAGKPDGRKARRAADADHAVQRPAGENQETGRVLVDPHIRDSSQRAGVVIGEGTAPPSPTPGKPKRAQKRSAARGGAAREKPAKGRGSKARTKARGEAGQGEAAKASRQGKKKSGVKRTQGRVVKKRGAKRGRR